MLTREEILKLLCEMNVVNYDNGRQFTSTQRLEAIRRVLSDNNSPYKRVNTEGLFELYSKVPLEKIENAVVISSHIDCVPAITEPFSKRLKHGMLHGTYDNSITNTAALVLMLSNALPDNVLISFTGDEEQGSRGALQTTSFLNSHGIPFFAIVTDVTGEGFDTECSYTVENDYLNDEDYPTIASVAKKLEKRWLFVPEDEDEEIPYCIPRDVIADYEADEDESSAYDEDEDVCCFSLCIPTEGNMHSNSGIFAREESFFHYIEALYSFALAFSESDER